jgi:hypothetical protein
VQAECHSFRVGSHGRGLSTGIPTPEPNDDKEQLREPKKKETQGLKHTNLAQSEPTAAGGKDELRAEKHEGAAQEDDPVLSSKLRAVDTPLEGKQSAQENTEENNSLYDASLRYVRAYALKRALSALAVGGRLLTVHRGDVGAVGVLCSQPSGRLQQGAEGQDYRVGKSAFGLPPLDAGRTKRTVRSFTSGPRPVA